MQTAWIWQDMLGEAEKEQTSKKAIYNLTILYYTTIGGSGMPASNRTMIHKLQTAINQHGGKILYEKTQFFSDDQNRPITIYKIAQALGQRKKEKLFESTSMIQIVFYLRDVWYTMLGKELPTDNEEWETVKKNKHIDYSLIIVEDNADGSNNKGLDNS